MRCSAVRYYLFAACLRLTQLAQTLLMLSDTTANGEIFERKSGAWQEGGMNHAATFLNSRSRLSQLDRSVSAHTTKC